MKFKHLPRRSTCPGSYIAGVTSLFWVLIIILMKEGELFFDLPNRSLRSSAPGQVTNIGSSIHAPYLLPSRQGVVDQTVAILIRCHSAYGKQLISLLWALDAQEGDHHIFVVVVPTEFDSIMVLKQILAVSWFNIHNKESKIHLMVQELDKHFYDEHCCLLKSICSEEWRLGKLARNWSTKALDTYCTINSPMHYFITDMAFQLVKTECLACTYFLVTNADNSYSPNFLKVAINSLENTKSDICLANMIHRGQPINVKLESGSMDLGCVVSRLDIFRSLSLTFSSLLPENAEPQDWHDADFWMVYNLVNQYHRRVTYLREYLFVHN